MAPAAGALTGTFRDPAPCGNEILDDRLKQTLGKHLLTIGCLSRLFAPRAESQTVLFADLPAGPAKVAFITEFNRQSFADRKDPDVLAGNVVALGGSAGGGSRKYYAGGVEVELPVFSRLTVNLAGRYRHSWKITPRVRPWQRAYMHPN